MQMQCIFNYKSRCDSVTSNWYELEDSVDSESIVDNNQSMSVESQSIAVDLSVELSRLLDAI